MTMSNYASSSNASMEDVTSTLSVPATLRTAEAAQQAHGPRSSYHLFTADTNGDLFLVRFPIASSSQSSSSSSSSSSTTSAPSYQPLPIRGVRRKGSSERAAQRLAYGQLKDGRTVVAIARRDATIDVIAVSTSSLPKKGTEAGVVGGEGHDHEQAEEQMEARLLVTLNEARMKPGLQRWVGLAVHPRGIVACTSSGAFTFFALAATPAAAEGERKQEQENTGISHLEAESIKVDLPGPLQQLTFYHDRQTAKGAPTHFAYGGEEVPLSVWDLAQVLSEAPSLPQTDKLNGNSSHQTTTLDEGHGDQEATGENAKARKRKRQAEARHKNKELMWGEVWRAKNLPNDALSLPQRANIVCLDFVRATDADVPSQEIGGDVHSDQDSASAESNLSKLRVVVGTRTGLVRVYNPSSGVRKHTSEHRIFTDASAVKTITAGYSAGEIFVSDTSGKLFAVDWTKGRTLYSYKDITGAVSSLLPLPAAASASESRGGLGVGACEIDAESSMLVSSSLDRMIRLHSTVPPHIEQSNHANGKGNGKRLGVSNKRGQVVASVFTGGPAAVACVWDGVVPVSAMEERGEVKRLKGESGEENGEEEDGEDDEDEIWDELDQVGTKTKKLPKGRASLTARQNAEEQGDDDDDEADQEAKKESRAKRRR